MPIFQYAEHQTVLHVRLRTNAGVMLERLIDIVPVVRRMMEDEVHYSRMRAATADLALPNATRQIVEDIAALIPQSEPAVLSDITSA